jgi:hypothetical protein
MPQQSHRDHGVTGQHWLLDQELASLSKGRAARPAALERVEVPLPDVAAIGDAAVPPRHNFVLFVAGLVTALLVYALLSNTAVVGALDEVFPNEGVRPLRITAADEPRASEFAELRGLLALRPPAPVERGSTPSNAPATQKPKSGKKSNLSGPDDGVLPPLPPPPAPPPVIPEIPPEIPAVEVPPLPELGVPELLRLPELPELP